jgi:transcriptional regulator with PAS, ATPase and Fis domain
MASRSAWSTCPSASAPWGSERRRRGRSLDAIEQLKRRMIEDALRDCGSKTRAAERLGLTRQSLQQMLRRRNG